VPSADVPTCTHKVELPHEARFLVNVLIDHGVPQCEAFLLDCPAVHEMARSIAQSNYIARADRLLLAERDPVLIPPLRFEPRSARAAVALMSLTALALLVLCTGIWRFFT
jgi:hypothetical protein